MEAQQIEIPRDFLTRYQRDSFQGLVRWEQVDDLWRIVRENPNLGWYAYTVGEAPPLAPCSETELTAFIDQVHGFIRAVFKHEHCGLVYVDHPEEPTYVIIYHPYRIMSCGVGSGTAALPGWTLTTTAPIDMVAALTPPRKLGLWQRLFRD